MTDQYVLINGDDLIVSNQRPMMPGAPDLHVGATLLTPGAGDYRWDGSVWVRIALPHQKPQP
jgi:hypothetical protein